MAKKKVFTEEQLKEAQRLASNGATRGEIAKFLNVKENF